MILPKCIRVSSMLLASVVLLTGCWDRTETNDLAFALSSASDLEENGNVRLTFLFPLPGQMGGASGGGGGTSGEKSFYLDSEVGRTYRESSFKLQKRLPRRIFLSHRRTLVISEELAKKKGISDVFDTIPRMPDSRLNTYIVIAKGKGYDLLQAQPRFERFSAEAIREIAKASHNIPLTVKDVGLALSFDSDPVIAYMEVKESQHGVKNSKEIAQTGYAQFRGDKMVGVYKDRSANGLMYLLNQFREHGVTFPIKADKYISLHVQDSNIRLVPILQEGKVSFQAKVTIKGNVREDAARLDLNESSVTHDLEEKFADYTKRSIQAAIDQMQEYGTDSAQLGLTVWRHYPHEWKTELERSWPELFKQATFDISVKASIVETGLINQNLLKDKDENE